MKKELAGEWRSSDRRAIASPIWYDICWTRERAGVLTMMTERRDGQALISITDASCGIPEEHMSRLFEPFFTTKTPEQGTGLGLAVVHQVITRHGGYIDISSQVNQGTTVTITLQLAEGIQHA